ncbi:MopE-related protein [Polyangium mundeleinium]|uniref:MopE-related protein n=1 Tax=Polyangium mundeleinium TaxID=2995306 RepID=A0ABT5F1V2_9BACT|nr:MopE-related protein [Polyangium mundeleinium]MDC0747070.1 MopE-related protein [Polyangium mundeleinium]
MRAPARGILLLALLLAPTGCNEIADIREPILDEDADIREPILDEDAGLCEPTNGGVETCDGLDNDCDGTVDQGPSIDYATPRGCGTCDNNCYELLLNNDPKSITCLPSPNPGKVPGTCTGTCAPNYHDLDDDEICEYYCVETAPDDASCNNKDDDCDGVIDEDVDLCNDLTNCGVCGTSCAVLHGTPECVHTGNEACSQANTKCVIDSCQDGWWDIDGAYDTGCEYACTVTNGGVEACGDALDNDCDGQIDESNAGDPMQGVDCYGDPDGICALPEHIGKTVCQGNKVVCGGPDVLVENQVPEICNGLDDDCDGVIDESPIDAGKPCGTSNIYPCAFGTQQCVDGALVCTGNIDPKPEACDGEDNDCDGTIDKAGNNPPADSVGACNVPPAPPAGATTACVAGAKACVGGTIVCQGSVTPAPGTQDGCNIDANCDGALTNQPDKQSDVNNCGMCGKSCYTGAVHSTWACVSGACQFKGCEPGYYDLNNDQKCEYDCDFISAQETCNGLDDDCDGQIDENVIAPSPAQVCGVSPSATKPECTTGVTVACVMGAWKCTFPTGVCTGQAPNYCNGTFEVCDNLDNDCDGIQNENVANWNKPCNSDDGMPPPGHGACRTQGTYICDGVMSVKCSAIPANCASLPGGCEETCDGLDNDCDGIADEPYNNKGNNATYYVKPAVTKIGSQNKWIMQFEASRPDATAVVPGTGNGFWTSGPVGATIDKTTACSVQNKIPWFNVTPREVEQVCVAAGGTVCTTADWQAAARLPAPDACLWGYAPLSACKTAFVAGTKYCNLGFSYDFSPDAGMQNGLLVTGNETNLKNCWVDWTGQTNAKLYDMTGNLREITKSATNTYPLLGGAFSTQAEAGAQSDFTFYTVDQNFQFFDTGFRCCFTSNPG